MSYIDSSTSKRAGTTGNKKGRVLIMQSATLVLGSEVNYRLYRTKRDGGIVYQIYTGYKRERVYCYVGSDLTAAENIFAAIVKGHVTPCTLTCIMEDLLPDPAENEATAVYAMNY